MKHSAIFFASMLCLPVAVGSCIIFDGGTQCDAQPGLIAPVRDPYTGECIRPIGTPGDCSSFGGTDVATTPPQEQAPQPEPLPDDEAEPAPGGAFRESPLEYPQWPSCGTGCEALDELNCTQTQGCQAAYLDKDGLYDELGPTFWGCWATDTYPVAGACDQLYADECVARDDCQPVYNSNNYDYAGAPRSEPSYAQEFAYCQAEPDVSGCYSDQDCGAGFDCTADTECLSPPGCEAGMDCPAVCYGRCVPDDVPPPLPGNCYGDFTCEEEAPACPSVTTPGIINNCWSGYCIPLSACESPACGTLASEASCNNAASCESVYQGSDCSCDASGCTCATLTYAYCKDA